MANGDHGGTLHSELFGESDATHLQLRPSLSIIVGAWYCLVGALAVDVGVRMLADKNHPAHYLLNSLAWIGGAAIGAAFASHVSSGKRRLVGVLASVPAALWWLRVSSMGTVEVDPVFGFRPTAFAFGLTLLLLTLIACAIAVIGTEESSWAAPLLNIRPRHWWWLWSAAFVWLAVIPSVLYYLLLEIVAVGYQVLHPSLWLSGTWYVGFGLASVLGWTGIGALLYGILLSLDSVSTAAKATRTKGKRIWQFVAGTILLAAAVLPLLLSWGTTLLKAALPSEHPWWIL